MDSNFDPTHVRKTHPYAPYDEVPSGKSGASAYARFIHWLHMTMEEEMFSNLAFARFVLIMTLIVISTIQYVAETVPEWEDWSVWVPLEAFVSIAFTVEFALRLGGARNALRFWELPEGLGGSSKDPWYVWDWLNFIDLLAVLPFYFEIMFSGSSASVVRVIRIVRLARLAKLAKSKGMKQNLSVLSDTLYKSMATSGSLVLGLIFVEVIVFSSLCYVCEKGQQYNGCPATSRGESVCKAHTDSSFPGRTNCQWMNTQCKGLYFRPSNLNEETPFTSIPATMWWTMTTITTVGYGDLYPTGGIGKVVGVLCQVTGLLVVAIVVTIIAGNFDSAHRVLVEQAAEAKKKDEKEFRDWIDKVQEVGNNVPSRLLEIESQLCDKNDSLKQLQTNFIELLELNEPIELVDSKGESLRRSTPPTEKKPSVFDFNQS